MSTNQNSRVGPQNDEDFIGVSDVVAMFPGITKATVYAWNYSGRGPQRYRVGKHCFYVRSEVREWARRHLQEAS